MNPSPLRELLERWYGADTRPDRTAPGEVVGMAREALALGLPTLACEILRTGGVDEHAAAEARYLAALAQARVGASARASAMAMSLLDDPLAAAWHVDALALSGRVAKDRWLRLPPGAMRAHAAKQAIDCYLRAWERSRDIFPGINAATMLRVAGDHEASSALARQVAAAAQDCEAAPHWRAATLAEAALLLDDIPASIEHYRSALRAAQGRVGDVASMRRQLHLLAQVMPVPPEVDAALALPRIVVFAGHMVDAADRARPRLPEAIEGALAARLAQRLDAIGAGFGYCSAACGADLIFVEAMLARGAEVHLVLPFERNDFVATSVAFAGPAWVERFEQALARVASVSYGVQERYLGDESLYAYAGRLMQGAALLRARELESEPMLLAVLDRDSQRLPGGTRDMLDNWRQLGLPSETIDPAALREVVIAPHEVLATAQAMPDVTLRAHPLRRQVRTMLFADMVGFSRLGEEDTPSFLVHFLGAIAEMLKLCGHPPAFVNTWGDGLFMVFDEVEHATDFALRLRDAVQDTDWPARGLPAGTSIRMGMHTGPVFEAVDPLIGRPNYFGSHVVRAARIEPVAVPGAIYVSAELAATLAASGATGFCTDYLGVMPLAKGYGSGALYRLRRSEEAE